jgi:hypothetical protein
MKKKMRNLKTTEYTAKKAKWDIPDLKSNKVTKPLYIGVSNFYFYLIVFFFLLCYA